MKKIAKICLALVLTVACLSQTTLGVFAAKKTTEYVSDVILSYGSTPEEAKKWLTDKGYKYVDSNLNDGADDTFSTKRAVYLGYKTTTDPDKAITDMKLMNMAGGYSVQDYQMILAEKKADIQQFIRQFIAVLGEYRTNYKAGSPRAVAAHNMLNVLKDDDTGLLMGDLLLNKIKEEYKAADFIKLSAEEQKQHADMTTILMQGNSQVVLCIEQILATATDTDSTLWLDRFAKEADDYDTMLETVMEEENVDPDKAEKILSTRYDEDAKVIGGMAKSYREWLDLYADSDAKMTDSIDKINACVDALPENDKLLWYTKGAQYEILNGIAYDDETTLLDVFLDEELDLTGEDAYLLYPVVSVLSDGQRAALDFVCGYQFVAMGLNTNEVTADTNLAEFTADEDGTVSVFAGVDRSMYSAEVALTGEAYKLQSSTDKDYSTNWFDDGISTFTKILGIITAASIAVTIGAFIGNAVFYSKSTAAAAAVRQIESEYKDFIHLAPYSEVIQEGYDAEMLPAKALAESTSSWSEIFYYASGALTVVSIFLSAYTLWCAYNDLKAYYNTDFTPIPMWMVDQGVDENNAKTFTYYKAVTCNRVEGKFTTDNTKLLKNFGDINGDVGKQWLALYTTTDKAAGNPITTEFTTQIGKATVPGEFTALSLFGNQAAQNLTDAKAGFTYNDAMGGIYLFYNTDTTLYAGSAVTTGAWVAIAGGTAAAVIAVAMLLRGKKKKEKAAA